MDTQGTASSKKSKLSDRNPLHEQALNKDNLKIDLKIDMNIQCYAMDQEWGSPALIDGEPFCRDNVWVVPVVTVGYAERLIRREWCLYEIGAIPREYPDGSSGWHPANYILDVS